jgi:hypothetical protein
MGVLGEMSNAAQTRQSARFSARRVRGGGCGRADG